MNSSLNCLTGSVKRILLSYAVQSWHCFRGRHHFWWSWKMGMQECHCRLPKSPLQKHAGKNGGINWSPGMPYKILVHLYQFWFKYSSGPKLGVMISYKLLSLMISRWNSDQFVKLRVIFNVSSSISTVEPRNNGPKCSRKSDNSKFCPRFFLYSLSNLFM